MFLATETLKVSNSKFHFRKRVFLYLDFHRRDHASRHFQCYFESNQNFHYNLKNLNMTFVADAALLVDELTAEKQAQPSC